jgi:hypothetical protein
MVRVCAFGFGPVTAGRSCQGQNIGVVSLGASVRTGAALACNM